MAKTKNNEMQNVHQLDWIMLGVIALAMLAAFLIGYSVGFRDGAGYTYDRLYISLTNSIRQVASDLDCKTTNSSITIEKRAAPLKCCYPSNCPEAKDNPKDCDCEYTLYCGPI